MAVTACAHVERPAPLSDRLFESGTLDQAINAVPFEVFRARYLPDGTVSLGVEYAANPPEQWVVQRFEWQGQVFYIKSEPRPPEFAPQREAEAMVRGRWVPITARYGEDGGVAQWFVYYEHGDIVHTVSGEIPAEELVRIAGGIG